MGLREAKKAKTRKLISNVATELFIEKGYDNVTTAEIAAKAEVSVMTLFNYFPTKKTLVFDEDQEREDKLVNAVRRRKPGTTILEALKEEFLSSDALKPDVFKHLKKFRRLIDSTPALAAHDKRVWMKHSQALAEVLAKESRRKIEVIEAEAIARFVLDAFHSSLHTKDPKRSLNSLFKLLKEGWKD